MRSMADFVLAGCLLAAAPSAIISTELAQQSSQADSASAQAAAAYDAKDWAKSAQLYAPMVKVHPEIPRLWFRLATSQQELGQPDQALQTMEQGLKVGVPPVFAEFSIATIYAQKGDKEKAFEHLQIALDAGYNKLEQFDSDVHLASLRGDPRLAKMRRKVEHNLKPCASTPENRQFDFWLGEWNVETTQGGVPAGQSTIELILGDCVIQENWQSDGNPHSGKRYNIYN